MFCNLLYFKKKQGKKIEINAIEFFEKSNRNSLIFEKLSNILEKWGKNS